MVAREWRRVLLPEGVRWLMARGAMLGIPPDGSPPRLAGVVQDVTARRSAEKARLLLAREVDHRAKNALAVVQAALRLTPADDPKLYAAAIEGRISALARAHALLARERWAAADLRAIVEGELQPFLPMGKAATRTGERTTSRGRKWCCPACRWRSRRMRCSRSRWRCTSWRRMR